MRINKIVMQYKEIEDMINTIYDFHDRPQCMKLHNDIFLYWEYDDMKNIFGGYWVKICIDGILVYRDYYIHDIPKEMKQQIKEEIKNLKKWNELQIRNDIYGKYYNLLNNRKKRFKIMEKERFLEEQKYLLDKYK